MNDLKDVLDDLGKGKEILDTEFETYMNKLIEQTKKSKDICAFNKLRVNILLEQAIDKNREAREKADEFTNAFFDDLED